MMTDADAPLRTRLETEAFELTVSVPKVTVAVLDTADVPVISAAGVPDVMERFVTQAFVMVNEDVPLSETVDILLRLLTVPPEALMVPVNVDGAWTVIEPTD